MNDKIIELEEYKRLLSNKEKLDKGKISIDDLSLEEIEDINKLGREELYYLSKRINLLKEENQRLKDKLKEGSN